MATIHAEDMQILIEPGFFQLVPFDENRLISYVTFRVAHGAGVIEYLPDFGAARHLPGDVLSIEYVQAAVIGYDEKTRRWLLGLHVQTDRMEKAQWVELARWPADPSDVHARDVQRAGRHLAETLGCPLKVFGAKKLPRTGPIGEGRSGVTGPLEPHKREDLTPERVRVYAASARLPVQYPGIWLGQSKDGVTLRLTKDSAKETGRVSPSYNQCVVDAGSKKVQLVPPTGILGAFFGGARGRSIPFADVRNIELRLTIQRESSLGESDEELATEIAETHYVWGVYLTLRDESLLLAQTSHATSGELLRQRAMAGDKFAVDPRSTMEYLRQHQEDQVAYQAAETLAHTVAVVIANTVGTRVVKTEVDLDQM